MGLKRRQSDATSKFKFYSTDQSDYDRQKRNVDLLFSWFAILALIDLAADLNMLVTISKSYDEYDSFESDMLADCSAQCFETSLCFAGAPCNASLCAAFASYDSSHSNDDCRVDSITNGGINASDVVVTEACNMLDRTDGYKDTLESLRKIRLTYGVFFSCSIFLTFYYLFTLWRKYKARVDLIPPVVKRTARSSLMLDKVDTPYFAPPTEDFPGRPAAPYYNPKNAAAKVAAATGSSGGVTQAQETSTACHGCKLRDDAREIYCRVCGKAFDEPETESRGIRRNAKSQKQSWLRKYQDYITSFVYQAGARFLVLTIEDMPQAIMIIMYVVTIDKPDGLYCMECAVEGQVCEFGNSYPRVAVGLVILGQLASVALLAVQILYLKMIETKQAKSTYDPYSNSNYRRGDFTWCGMDTYLLLALIPAFVAPVLITILVTDMRLILDISTSSDGFIALVVLAVVFSLPWIVLCALITFIVSELCCDDCDVCCEVCDACEACGDCLTCCCG